MSSVIGSQPGMHIGKARDMDVQRVQLTDILNTTGTRPTSNPGG